MRRAISCLLLGLFCLAMAGCSKNAPFHVGDQVVLKETKPLHDGERIVDEGRRFRVYIVERAEGGRALLAAGKVRGWVDAKDLVLWKEAIDYFTKMIQDNPTSSLGNIKRARIWWFLKETDKAIADYTEAIRLEPNDAQAYAYRGSVWGDTAEHDKAFADYSEAIRLDPSNAQAFAGRSVCWYHKKEFDKAIADATEAIRCNPIGSRGYEARGYAYIKEDELDKAFADFNKAIRFEPDLESIRDATIAA